MLNPYNSTLEMLFDPTLWPAYGMFAGTFIAPVVGLMIRAVFGRRCGCGCCSNGLT